MRKSAAFASGPKATGLIAIAVPDVASLSTRSRHVDFCMHDHLATLHVQYGYVLEPLPAKGFKPQIAWLAWQFAGQLPHDHIEPLAIL